MSSEINLIKLCLSNSFDISIKESLRAGASSTRDNQIKIQIFNYCYV